MKALILTIAAALLGSLSAGADVSSPSSVIPRPTSVVESKGQFNIPADRRLTFSIKGQADPSLSTYIAEALNAEASTKRPDIAINIASPSQSHKAKPESYSMKITSKGIDITAPTAAGAFYAVQTLMQMLSQPDVDALQCATITDTPRFDYRGMHFDVSRHFRSKEFIKKQMDAMAALKLNRLHLHLTDGAGWRLQIDRYPRLTEFAAWRPQEKWTDWTAEGAKYCESTDPRASGGFYTKDDIRELLDYAGARNITIIPEIEMPGHSEEVLAAYPELSCSGQPYSSSDFCPGKEATFEFLENVLDEVIDLFPSHYIHIGGDEASKNAWRECADCKARMEAENLKDVDELQSYLIKRIERYVNTKGRSIIGWDEILEGGVAPNATVMSWRGTEGGIKSLKSGHNVVMTPGAYCYLDYCQDAPFKEPSSIGGYTPLRNVYSYEPLEPGLTDEEASNLLGLQANLWSEYIPTDAHAEYMYYPRVYAIAEIAWSTPEKDFDNFQSRALTFNDIMKQRGYNPFDLRNEYGERRQSLEPIEHLGRGAKVEYRIPYHRQYPAAGDSTLTDGIRGGWTYGDKRWQGTMRDMDVVVDLGEVKPIHYVGATFMQSEGAWVHLPEKVEFSLSTDGVNFSEPTTVWMEFDPYYNKIMFKDYGSIFDAEARYVRMQATKNPRPGAWLFTDEIVIN